MKKYIEVSIIISFIAMTMPAIGQVRCNNSNIILTQFNKLDTNNDKLISKSEVEAQPEFTRNMEISNFAAFDISDSNSDGKLDFDEFYYNEKVILSGGG